MKRTERVVRVVAFVILSAVLAQAPTYSQTQSDASGGKNLDVVSKLVRVELLHQLMPVLLKKEQYRKLLYPIEQCRKKVSDLQKAERNELSRLDSRLDKAISGAKQNSNSPPRELMEDISKFLYGSQLSRQLLAQENVDTVLKVFMDIADVGQRRAAANSLDPRAFGINRKPEEMTEEEKVRMFVSEVLLHPLAYDILIYFSKDQPSKPNPVQGS